MFLLASYSGCLKQIGSVRKGKGETEGKGETRLMDEIDFRGTDRGDRTILLPLPFFPFFLFLHFA
jgi:hypothetical protein